MKFTLGEVLSITDGRLMCKIDGVYRILNHMTVDNLMTHQLPRAMRECQTPLLAQFPHLTDAIKVTVTPENYLGVLEDLRAKFGDEFEVQPLAEHVHEFIEPLSELAEMVHPSKIIVI